MHNYFAFWIKFLSISMSPKFLSIEVVRQIWKMQVHHHIHVYLYTRPNGLRRLLRRFERDVRGIFRHVFVERWIVFRPMRGIYIGNAVWRLRQHRWSHMPMAFYHALYYQRVIWFLTAVAVLERPKLVGSQHISWRSEHVRSKPKFSAGVGPVACWQLFVAVLGCKYMLEDL